MKTHWLLFSTYACQWVWRHWKTPGSARNNSYLWTHDLYSPVRNAFDAGKSITRASGRALGPRNRDIFWRSMKGNELLGEWHLGPKKVEISRAQPSPTCQSNGVASTKSITYGATLTHRSIIAIISAKYAMVFTWKMKVHNDLTQFPSPLCCRWCGGRARRVAAGRGAAARVVLLG